MKKLIPYLIGLTSALISVAATQAQTSAFTYQGKLSDAAGAANGTYQMQFSLFTSASGGSQVGATLTFDGSPTPTVQVANGIFTVQLDFGASPFTSGADRFLEISVKHAADPGYTTLAPRQQLTASPYSIRTLAAGTADALSSACVGCVTDAQINGIDGSKVTGSVASATNATNATNANNATTASSADNAIKLNNLAASNYVLTTDPRLSDSRSPTAGSAFYIQNQTATTQTSAFKINGTGTANVLDATAQFNLNGNRMLIGTANNFFAGFGAGAANTSGVDNTFVGASSGLANKDASGNTFFGTSTGGATIDGQNNTFVGAHSGKNNVHGISNAFFGADAGANNTANNNAFFGASAGQGNVTGTENAFFGTQAGMAVTVALNNAFFGAFAGSHTVSNGNNSFFGAEAGFNSTGLRNSFFGAFAGNNTTSGSDNATLGNFAGMANTTGSNNTILGSNADMAANNLLFASAIGANAKATANDTIVLGKVAGTYNSVSRPADAVIIPGNLTVNGTLTAPAPTTPNIRIQATTAQTFPNNPGIFQEVHFNSILFGSGMTFDDANDHIVVQRAGLYQVSGQINWAANGTGWRGMQLTAGGNEVCSSITQAASSGDTVLTGSCLARLNAGDVIDMQADQNSGGNLNTAPFDFGAAFISAVWVGP
jgi:hypothetical protein